MMAAKNTMQNILNLAGEFVTKQQGDWDHAAWEGFIADLEKLGVPATDEAKHSIGSIIEAAKYFYGLAPAASAPKPAAKKTAATPKAAAKPKATAKPKTAPKPPAKKR